MKRTASQQALSYSSHNQSYSRQAGAPVAKQMKSSSSSSVRDDSMVQLLTDWKGKKPPAPPPPPKINSISFQTLPLSAGNQGEQRHSSSKDKHRQQPYINAAEFWDSQYYGIEGHVNYMHYHSMPGEQTGTLFTSWPGSQNYGYGSYEELNYQPQQYYGAAVTDCFGVMGNEYYNRESTASRHYPYPNSSEKSGEDRISGFSEHLRGRNENAPSGSGGGGENKFLGENRRKGDGKKFNSSEHVGGKNDKFSGSADVNRYNYGPSMEKDGFNSGGRMERCSVQFNRAAEGDSYNFSGTGEGNASHASGPHHRTASNYGAYDARFDGSVGERNSNFYDAAGRTASSSGGPTDRSDMLGGFSGKQNSSFGDAYGHQYSNFNGPFVGDGSDYDISVGNAYGFDGSGSSLLGDPFSGNSFMALITQYYNTCGKIPVEDSYVMMNYILGTKLYDRETGFGPMFIRLLTNGMLMPEVKPKVDDRPPQKEDLIKEFPVASGIEHRAKESQPVETLGYDTRVYQEDDNTNQKVSETIHTIRQKALKDLQLNPSNEEAKKALKVAEKELKAWLDSRPKSHLGEYTGKAVLKMMTPEQIKEGRPAWMNRDKYRSAPPLKSGVGLLLLKKMGWRQGEGLGKLKQGSYRPFLDFSFKIDRKGLRSNEPEGTIFNPLPKTVHSLPCLKSSKLQVTTVAEPPKKSVQVFTKEAGYPESVQLSKNPITALMEICVKNKWKLPEFDFKQLTLENKNHFIPKVTVHGRDYSIQDPFPSKKHAKAYIASLCLQFNGVKTV